MIRIEILKKYVKNSGRSWKDIAWNVSRLPDTLAELERIYKGEATTNEAAEILADTLETLMLELKMPASVAGYVFFADPETDDEGDIIGAAEPKYRHDCLLELFEDLDLRAQHRILALAYDLHDQKEAARRTGASSYTSRLTKQRVPRLGASDYSVTIEELDEDAIISNYNEGIIKCEHNAIDSLLAAWQMTSSYPGEYPENLKEAVENAKAAISGPYAEEAITAIEDAATTNGFALGVQFALAAAAKDGAVWEIIQKGFGLK